MSKVKVNELSKHDASEITVNDDVVLASGKSVSSPSISTDTISEKTSAAGVTIDGVLLKDNVAHSGLVKLASQTASNDNAIIFDNFVDHSTYIHYYIVFKNIQPSTDNVDINMKFRVGGASGSNGTDTYRSGGLYYAANSANSGFFSNESTTNYKRIHDAQGTNANEGFSGQAFFYPASVVDGASIPSMLDLRTHFESASDVLQTVSRTIFAYLVSTGLNFYMSSGNIESGEIVVYGVKK